MKTAIIITPLGWTDESSEDEELLAKPKDPTSPAVTPHEPKHEPEEPSTEVGPFKPIRDEGMKCGDD